MTTGQVVLAGEVKSSVYLDVQKIARDVINRIGYTKGEDQFDGNSCGALSAIHEQSDDINRGVDRASKEEQASYKRIRIVEFKDEIPKSASGKILRRFLRDNRSNMTPEPER